MEPDPTAPHERDVLDPRGWLAATLLVLVPVALTGWWQVEHYRPATATPPSRSPQAWEDLLTLHDGDLLAWSRSLDGGHGWVSDAHRGFATTFVALGAVFVACLFRWAWRKRGGDAVAVVAALVGVGAVALAPASGRGLLWDNLALWAVTVDGSQGGVWYAAFSDQVRFVLAHGHELSQGTYRGDVIEHVAVMPALLVGAAVALVWRLRRAGRAD